MTREYNVIDADGHVLEPPDLWERYIEPRYRDRCPKLVIDGEGNESFFVDETFDFGLRRRGKEPATLGAARLDRFARRRGRHPRAVPRRAQGRLRSARAHPRHGRAKESTPRSSIRASACSWARSRTRTSAAAACRAYNRWLADYCKPYPDRLFGAAMLPMQSVDAARR